MKKRIIIISYFLVLASPILASAAGIVPCGGPGENACQFCDLLVLLQNVINFLLEKVLFPVGTILMVWGGIRIMAARGNPGEAKKGMEIITTAVIGILIALLGWVIIDTILKILTGGSLGGNPAQILPQLGPWNQIKCSV